MLNIKSKKFNLLAGCALVLGSSSEMAMAQANEAASAENQAPSNGTGQPLSEAQARAAATSGAADEIVVTATRQETQLSKVPISVAAFNQATLDQTGIRRAEDLSRLTPGLTFTNPATDAAGTSTNVAIRGISSQVGSATTGIYIDDTPIQTRIISNQSTNVYPQVFDLERVEVLRGPQGTLFGAGAEGGVVRFITAQPSLTESSGNARAELAFTESGAPSYEVGAAVGSPIIDGKLGLRLSGNIRRDGGYVDQVDRFSGARDDNFNVTRTYSLRGAVTAQPVDGLTMTLSVFHQDIKASGTQLFFQNASDLSAGKLVNQAASPDRRRDRFTLPTLSIKADLGFADLISTTAYFDRHAQIQSDSSYFISSVLFRNPLLYRAGEYSSVSVDDTQKNITQELRLQSRPGRFTWTIGAFIAKNRQRGEQFNFDPFVNALAVRLTGATVPQLTGIPLVAGGVFHSLVHTTDKQQAGFGEASFEVVDNLKVTAGVRVAHSTLDFDRLGEGPAAGRTVRTGSSTSQTPVTPRFGISYQATPDTLLYASAAKGFRLGGGNGAVIALCSAQLAQLGLTGSPETYKSDSVWSYEAGAKTRLAGGKISIQGSAFLIDWSDIQQRIFLSSCGSGFVANLGKARSTGFDLAIQARPVDNLTLGASVGYANARLTQTIGSPGAYFGRKGDKIGASPWQVTASAQYDLPLADDRAAYVRGDYQYQSKSPDPDLQVVGTDPASIPYDAFNQLSLRVGYRFGRADISAFADNVLNERPLLFQLRDTTASPLFYGRTTRPRTYGMTGTVRF